MENNKNRKINKKGEGFSGLIFTGALIMLFVFAIINAGIYFSQQNGQESVLLNNSAINNSFISVSGNLTDLQETAEDQSRGYFADIPIIGDVEFFVNAIWGFGRTFKTVVSNSYNLTFGLFAEVLGISTVILNVFTTFIVILIILLAWRLYKVGQ